LTGYAPVAILRLKAGKLPGFGSARCAICPERSSKESDTRAFDIHNTLNRNVLEEQNPAVQFKLDQSASSTSIRLLTDAHAA
jgi:hypothetical protein